MASYRGSHSTRSTLSRPQSAHLPQWHSSSSTKSHILIDDITQYAEKSSVPKQNRFSSSTTSSSKSSKSWYDDEELIKELYAPPIPHQDGGAPAWRFLIGAGLAETAAWSMVQSFGVLRDYYFTHLPFQGVKEIAAVGLISGGILQIMIPFLLSIAWRFPQYRKHMQWTGLGLCIIASLGAGESTQPWHIFATQGVLYGIGASCIMGPMPIFLTEWYDRRTTFAAGFGAAVSGTFGSFIPLLHSKLLQDHGPRTTLQVHAACSLLVGIVALLLIKPRLPIESAGKHEDSSETKIPDYQFLKNTSFYLLLISIFSQSIVFGIPSTFLPSYATDLHISPKQAALLASILNLALASGQISWGVITDRRCSPTLALIFATVVPAFAALFLWGEAKTLRALMTFAVVYGAFAGGYSILRSRLATVVAEEVDGGSDDMVYRVLGIFIATRGVGYVVGGATVPSLVRQDQSIGSMRYGLGRYGILFAFVATGLLLATLFGGAQWVHHRIRKGRSHGKIGM